MWRRRLLLIVIFGASCPILTGCVIPGGLHQPTLARMRQSVVAAVPLGAPVATAEKTMEAHGYRCRYSDGWLGCESFGSLPYELFTRKWSVRFAVKDGVVADYQVWTDLNAP